ncbi:hypothetical protein BDW02DRAFT_356178 [Decorospora gaudefroyi]|uniref:Uncharacterized protein n=1 Tax=Decorospora gaudefroyi TaxID=184978 RepID=A0A6A5K983_9PLEO|nr:hypothetical protein BDW02DRAFT_356178 [Decorospora gaudefroyi]
MVSRLRFAEGVSIQEDLVDDSTGVTPMVGLCTPLSLKTRFLCRLSELLAADVTIQEENDNTSSMEIFVSRKKTSLHPRIELDEELRKFVPSLEEAMGAIASTQGPRHDDAIEDLWDSVLGFSYGNIDHVVHSLQQAFDRNQGEFEDLVTKMIGMDNVETKVDQELGDRVILLRHAIDAYDGSMKELNVLIHQASEMTRVLLNIKDRFRYLLGKARFGNELYQLICTLGFPERVYSTLVRAAKAQKTFKHVSFHVRPLSPPTPATSVALVARKKTRSRPQRMPQKQYLSKPMKRYKAAALPQPTPPPPPFGLDPLMDTVQPYLPPEDRGLGLIRLQPATKQATIELIGTVLRGNILPIRTTAWYAFGFVTTKDEDAERDLAGLYAAIVKEAEDPQTIFQELLHALETHKLPTLFDTKQYPNFRTPFPYLEPFLTAQPSQRFTVWRLRQFIYHPTDTDPPPCLQRDYGFRFCKQREEVERLKAIYKQMLQKLGPVEVHNACYHGTLYVTAIKNGLNIEARNQRLMVNDASSPHVGFDDEAGLEGVQGRLFKRRVKL